MSKAMRRADPRRVCPLDVAGSPGARKSMRHFMVRSQATSCTVRYRRDPAPLDAIGRRRGPAGRIRVKRTSWGVGSTW
jgi:hypothetical protein